MKFSINLLLLLYCFSFLVQAQKTSIEDIEKQLSDCDSLKSHLYTNPVLSPTLYVAINQLIEHEYYACAERLLKIVEERSKADTSLSDLYDLYNRLYRAQQQYRVATRYSLKAIDLLTESSQKHPKIKHLNNLGETIRTSNYDTYTRAVALRYLEEAQAIGEGLESPPAELVRTYNRIAAVYGTNGNGVQTQKDRQQIIIYSKKSLELSKKLLADSPGDRFLLDMKANSYNEIGFCYMNMGKLNVALRFMQKSVDLREKYQLPQLIESYINLAHIYARQENYTASLQILDKTLELAKRLEHKIHIHVNYAMIFERQKKPYEMANHWHLAYDYSKQSKQQVLQKITQDLAAKYDFEKKEQEIKLSEQKRQLQESKLKQQQLQNRLLLILICLGLTFATYLLYNNYQKNKKNRLLLHQKNTLSKQAKSLENTNRQLRELSAFKEQMTNLIAHDLKNPLNVLMGLSQQSLNQEKRELMYHSSRNMLELINNMLEVYEAQEKSMQLNPSTFALNSLFEEVVSDMRFLLDKKKLTVILDTIEGLIVEADAYLIKRLLVNLLSNAIKYSPLNGKIQIKTTLDEQQQIIISVKDEGVGISQSLQDKIFEPFVKEQNLLGSSGLGLTFCKMAIDAHNGHITIDSAPNQGTTFYVYLPKSRLKEKASPQITQTKFEPERKSQAPKKQELTSFQKEYGTLKRLEVFQTSEILQVLTNIRQRNISKNLQSWLDQIEDAVYVCNSDEYQRLINLSKPSAVLTTDKRF